MTGKRGMRLQRRTWCPVCESREIVNLDGTLRMHKTGGGRVTRSADKRCTGSGSPAGPANARAMSWDWKAQPDLHQLAKMVLDVSGGIVHIREVDTGGDFYLLVVADHAVTDDEALELRLG